MKGPTVLVVDDELYVRESLAELLGRKGFDVRTAGSIREALHADRLSGLDVALVDLRLGEEDGAELVSRLIEREPHLPVLVLTAHGSVGSAVECMRRGAVDYLLKPAEPAALRLALERALDRARARRELEYLRSGVGASPKRRAPLGESAQWKKVLELVEVAAPVDTSVLLVGETGTGKEEVARLLHERGARAGGPYVRVNCAAVPETLFESEFFGHRKGAFTGALQDREGRFRVAHTGTLLLDEVDALSPAAQAKVLRVLQDGEFDRVGDSRPTRVDVRVLCATNKELPLLVEEGRFRADLFYRINVLTLPIPPLRERPEDVEVLASAFLEEFASRFGKRVEGIHPKALLALKGYEWPGNVRELRNVVERGVLLCRGDELGEADLPFGDGTTAKEAPDEPELELRSTLLRTERWLLEEALRRSDGVKRKAAGLLGIDERNLPYYLRKHGLGGEAE